jgi:hypothetical protein
MNQGKSSLRQFYKTCDHVMQGKIIMKCHAGEKWLYNEYNSGTKYISEASRFSSCVSFIHVKVWTRGEGLEKAFGSKHSTNLYKRNTGGPTGHAGNHPKRTESLARPTTTCSTFEKNGWLIQPETNKNWGLNKHVNNISSILLGRIPWAHSRV